MRKIISACLAGLVVGVLQSMYFSISAASWIDVIASPFILLSTVVGLGSGLAATETDNVVVNILVGMLAGVIVYSFVGYYSGMYLVVTTLGIISGAITGFIAYAA